MGGFLFSTFPKSIPFVFFSFCWFLSEGRFSCLFCDVWLEVCIVNCEQSFAALNSLLVADTGKI